METLNPQQRQAVKFDGHNLLVLAGAGTGKTRTIIARAHHLIESGSDPRRILILSFTRKSAREIVERIAAQLPDSQADGLNGLTFHSWCMSVIKNHPQVFPQADYTLLDEDDQESCFRLICGKHWQYRDSRDKKVKPEQILQVYSYMVNARCSLSDAIRMKLYDNAPAEMDVERDVEVIKGVMAMYFEFKRSRRYMDYDDILLTVSKYLKRHPDLRSHITGLYDHILIDEMQDTNPLQYELLESFQEDCHLFCVGDDAQSIYAFRGADFKTVHRFKEIIPESEVQRLTLNYRSTQEILDLSNWLLEQSPLHYDKRLRAHRGPGQLPEIRHWATEWEEADDVAASILESNRDRGNPWREHLVLSRSNYGLKKVEASLLKLKIPYTVFGGRSIMATRHVRDLVAPMRIVANYLDEIAWSRYLQLWNNVGPVTAASIIGSVVETESFEDSVSVLMECALQKHLDTRMAETLLRIHKCQYNPAKAVDEAIATMSDRLKELYKDEWSWRKEDFPLLKEVASKSGTIGEFIAEFILDPKLETTSKEGTTSDDIVTLSTIHSAKGLEAKCVYLVNASVNSYPTQRAVMNGEEAVEEERRCLYVALTRAKDTLVIYRDIHSVHTPDTGCDRYFFNKLPASLYQSSSIASHWFGADPSGFGKPIDEDIYSDFDLS